MLKHPKQAFSIFEDGHRLLIVHLIKDNDQVFLNSIDSIDLNNPIYHKSEDQPSPDAEFDNWDEQEVGNTQKPIDFDVSSSVEATSSIETLFSGYVFQHGVIAVNINDENIIRCMETPKTSKSIIRYAKEVVNPQFYKTGNWQSSLIQIADRTELWIHQGINMLLELLVDYQKKNRLSLYYQLADANDVALTDYFKRLIVGIPKRFLLVYVGEEYRKAFVFEGSKWVDTLTLQIPHRKPDAEVICSKLSLALDSSSRKDPEAIIICGDAIDPYGLQVIKSHFEGMEIDFIGFPELIVDEERVELQDKAVLSQYAIPIALALKALYPEDTGFTPSNFLPASVVEGQKLFKIAWHGFLILGLVFLTTLYLTQDLLKGSKDYRRAKSEKSELTQVLGQRRLQAKELQAVRRNLELSQKNVEGIITLLDNKNPWSYLLNDLNHTLESLPTSWLNNLREEDGTLMITGMTTKRANVIKIADTLPNSQIRKVTNSKIRDYTLWQFEISSSLPSFSWKAMIQDDLDKLKEFKEIYGERNQEQATSPNIVSLGTIPVNLILAPPPEILRKQDAVTTDYINFTKTLTKNSVWKYKEAGQRFLDAHRKSRLTSYVRWLLAYRLYVDKEYDFAQSFAEPLLTDDTEHYAYDVFLLGRIYYAQKNDKYKKMYKILQRDYSNSKLTIIVNEDLKVIGSLND